MASHRVTYHEDVGGDLEGIPANMQRRLKRAVEDRLRAAPNQYGEPLREELLGLRKLRVGDYRIVYEVQGDLVTIWGIQHRRGVYPAVVRRWIRGR